MTFVLLQIDQRSNMYIDDQHHLLWAGNILLQDSLLWIHHIVSNYHLRQVNLIL